MVGSINIIYRQSFSTDEAHLRHSPGGCWHTQLDTIVRAPDKTKSYKWRYYETSCDIFLPLTTKGRTFSTRQLRVTFATGSCTVYLPQLNIHLLRKTNWPHAICTRSTAAVENSHRWQPKSRHDVHLNWVKSNKNVDNNDGTHVMYLFMAIAHAHTFEDVHRCLNARLDQ